MSESPASTSQNGDLKPLQIGLVGLGGYGATICETLLQSPRSRLRCVFEPNYAPHVDQVARLKAAGVALCDSYAALLAHPIEAVWLPVPIHLHRPFTEQALAHGIAVICEKPAAGIVQDLDAMIVARDRARVPVAIGFQQLCSPEVLSLKRQLVAGDFGQIKSISLAGCWPRSSAYYGRNAWAGRMRFGDTWILDSPLANAMNHYLQLALYFGGATLGDSAVGRSVEAELYRANPIENFDTCCVRVITDREIPLLVLMTHACEKVVTPAIRIRCTNGEARLFPEDRIDWKIGSARGSIPFKKNVRFQLVEAFHEFVRHVPEPTSPIATLEIARAPLAIVNAVSMAAEIKTLPAEFVDSKNVEDGTLRFIDGIESACKACEATQQTFSESGIFPWTVPLSKLPMQAPNHFVGLKTTGV